MDKETNDQGWLYQWCYLKRAIDGDTFEMVVDVGFKMQATITVRLNGIDTPETYRPSSDAEYQAGLDAKQLAEQFMHNGDDWVALVTYNKGSFGRWVADVVKFKTDDMILTEGNYDSLSQYLTNLGYNTNED